MQYLLLIYGNESKASEYHPTPESQQAYMGEYFKFTSDLKEAGAMLGGEALQPTATASTVRVRDGKALHTDGPFAETKEQLGGFYFIEADNLDEALKWAAQIPTVRTGCVEVRPIIKFDPAT